LLSKGPGSLPAFALGGLHSHHQPLLAVHADIDDVHSENVNVASARRTIARRNHT
jgi:hypothetical protein